MSIRGRSNAHLEKNPGSEHRRRGGRLCGTAGRYRAIRGPAKGCEGRVSSRVEGRARDLSSAGYVEMGSGSDRPAGTRLFSADKVPFLCKLEARPRAASRHWPFRRNGNQEDR